MGTLFLIFVRQSRGAIKPLYSCGPYTTLNQASTIMFDHLPSILMAEGIREQNYIVELHEVLPLENGWELIDIKITADEQFHLE